mgnify:CR=1 FL=1
MNLQFLHYMKQRDKETDSRTQHARSRMIAVEAVREEVIKAASNTNRQLKKFPHLPKNFIARSETVVTGITAVVQLHRVARHHLIHRTNLVVVLMSRLLVLLVMIVILLLLLVMLVHVFSRCGSVLDSKVRRECLCMFIACRYTVLCFVFFDLCRLLRCHFTYFSLQKM